MTPFLQLLQEVLTLSERDKKKGEMTTCMTLKIWNGKEKIWNIEWDKVKKKKFLQHCHIFISLHQCKFSVS